MWRSIGNFVYFGSDRFLCRCYNEEDAVQLARLLNEADDLRKQLGVATEFGSHDHFDFERLSDIRS